MTYGHLAKIVTQYFNHMNAKTNSQLKCNKNSLQCLTCAFTFGDQAAMNDNLACYYNIFKT